MQALVGEWWEDGNPLNRSLILAGTNGEVDRLNLIAQAKRMEAGHLSKNSTAVDGTTLYEGDYVRFTKKHKMLGVAKNDFGTVLRISEDGSEMTVLLDTGERVSFEVDAMPDLKLGYASTTHRAQGSTSINSYILAGGPMQDRELSYVQVSRATTKTALFVTRIQAGDELSYLAKSMERSHRKEMAHTYLRELRSEYGESPDLSPDMDD